MCSTQGLLKLREFGVVRGQSFQQQESSQTLGQLFLSHHQSINVASHGRAGFTSVDVGYDDRYILAGDAVGGIKLFDLANIRGSVKHTAVLIGVTHDRQSKAAISRAQWYPGDNDGGLLTASDMNGRLRVFDANRLCDGNGRSTPVETFQLSKKLLYHDMSPVMPSLLAAATDTNHVRLVDLRSGCSTQELRGHKSSLLSVKWAPTIDNLLASSCLNGNVLLWDIRKARNCLMSLDFENVKQRRREGRKRSHRDSNITSDLKGVAHNGAVNGLSFTADSKCLITRGCFDGRIRKWNLIDQGINLRVPFETLQKANVKNSVPLETSGDMTSLENELIFVPVDADILVFRSWDGKRIKRLSGHFRTVNSCVLSRLNHELYSASSDQNILIWECNTSRKQMFGEYEAVELSKLPEAREQEVAIVADDWSSDED